MIDNYMNEAESLYRVLTQTNKYNKYDSIERFDR